ncbi:unannotated protein [freshwater metagenome]|uniref:Unannotated protein n=1 Tax=freshwater metagenome TaxID=449393 RepID=A0A6J7XZ68_9ZZZZ|nr:globin [Actinomycetota bacterium]
MTFYDEVGSDTFADLVSQFYARVAMDPIISPMYPPDDMKAAAQRLQMFLEQYWGGPTTYTEERGHPRLRMRHAGFHIDLAARDAWLGCMRAALAGVDMREDLKAQFREYIEMAAHALVNQPD